jgi:hypothetical protein
MVRERTMIDHLAPSQKHRLHPLVWLLFIDAALALAAFIVVMLSYEGLPYDREPSGSANAVVNVLVVAFAVLFTFITAWLIAIWFRRR